MSFKIIAIKALQGCDPKYIKILKEEELYYFHQDYVIKINPDSKEEITIKKSTPSNLYNIQGKSKEISINISAIVGKNGSGKSTVVELLFRAINNIAFKFKNKEKGDVINTITADIQELEGLKVAFYYQVENIISKVEVINTEHSIYVFEQLLENKYILNARTIDGFLLDQLFYTEVINYSHYAYNSKYEGSWIQKLFHKNDSYQTPVVFNPMRTEGNVDINRENDLVRQRLIANLLRPVESDVFNFRQIGDNLEALNIKLSLKEMKNHVIVNPVTEEKIGLSGFDSSNRNELLEKSIQIIVDENFKLTDAIKDISNFNHSRAYILYKLISIAVKYEEYESYFYKTTKKFNKRRLNEYLVKLKEDKSHITFKLKQALHYVYFYNSINYLNEEEIDIERVSKDVLSIMKEKPSLSIMELLPSPIFKIEIILGNDVEEPIPFESLSSGEKQSIYSVSSILYHLINLDSVSNNKIQYKNINIVMEEIELYFHPDFQRQYIYNLLKGIENIQLKNIEALNLCFVTHSPFILSDIPSNNIMFLEIDNSDRKSYQVISKKKTLGANIHDILSDSFFFDNEIYIGRYIKNEIEELVKNINLKQNGKENNLEKNLSYYQELILALDEPVLKLKLTEMLAEVTNDNIFYNNVIDKEIDTLKKRKKVNS